MNRSQTLAFYILAALCASCSATPPSDSPEAASRALNAQSKASLGVSVRSLAFLFDTDSGTYLAKNSVSLQNSWEHLKDLEAAGYVTVHTIPSAQGDLVQIVLTPKGHAVAGELSGP